MLEFTFGLRHCCEAEVRVLVPAGFYLPESVILGCVS